MHIADLAGRAGEAAEDFPIENRGSSDSGPYRKAERAGAPLCSPRAIFSEGRAVDIIFDLTGDSEAFLHRLLELRPAVVRYRRTGADDPSPPDIHDARGGYGNPGNFLPTGEKLFRKSHDPLLDPASSAPGFCLYDISKEDPIFF